MTASPLTRLNKFIAHATGISRREADIAIEQGRVTVNGAVATLGTQVNTASDRVTVDNKPVTAAQHYTYIALHKPVGYICSRRRQGDTPTIYELLPPQYRALKPVGRLDRDSSGILLLTDDGDFAHRMTHPGFHKTKIYEVSLDQPLQPLHQQMISDYGVALEDGVSRFLVEKIEPSANENYRVTMHEGRNRQIRRTFAALGYTVTTLHRTTFGSYSLGNLAPGKAIEVQLS